MIPFQRLSYSISTQENNYASLNISQRAGASQLACLLPPLPIHVIVSFVIQSFIVPSWPPLYRDRNNCGNSVSSATRTITETMRKRHGRHRSSIIVAFVAIIVGACLVAAQDNVVLEEVIANTMEKLCFTPCENGFSGNEGA